MEFWGHKTDAFLDVWSIEHLVMGISIGSMCLILKRFNFFKCSDSEFLNKVIIVLLVSFAWETLEHYLETGLAGVTVQEWFAGVEHWSNRLISDHLMVILGLMIYTVYPILLWPARAFSVIWLFVHIFIFPHSMYLHEL